MPPEENIEKVETEVVRPSVIIYTDDASIVVTGIPKPSDLASVLMLFSKGDLSDELCKALEDAGMTKEWIADYQETVKDIVKTEMKRQNRPIITALEAYR